MEISLAEKLNIAILRGGKGYEEWNNLHHLPDYLSLILYELLIRKKATQKDLVNLSDLPKQSINKGIKILQDKDYLELIVNPKDKRQKYCRLTPSGKKYAQQTMQPLMDIEEEVVRKMGAEKMHQFISLNEEWNDYFWDLLRKEDRNEHTKDIKTTL